MPRRLLPILICGFALLLAAPAAHALPAGAVSMSGKKADCLGGRGAPCGPIVRGLMNPVTGVFSSDGRSFYVGSLGNGGIVAMARDVGSGRLAPVPGVACIGYQLGCERSAHPMPSALAISPDDRSVYAGGAGTEEGLLAFTRDPGSGALTPSGCLRGYRDACSYPGGSEDDYIRALEVTPDGRFIVSAGDAGIGVVNRDPASGALSQTPGNCVVRSSFSTGYDQPSKGCRIDRRIGMPLGLDLSPDGATAYVAADDGGLSAYAIDRATGAPALADREPGGFYEVAVSPDGRNVYAVTEEFDVHAFSRDPGTGALTRIRGKRGCISYVRGCTWLKGVSSPEDFRVSPDGRHVYVAAAEGVSVLRRLPGGGLRQLRGRAGCNVMRDPLDTPRMRRECHHGPYELNGLTGFEIAPGGRHLYALESASNGTRGVGVVQLLRRN